jgi:hypothetical protein
MNAVHKERCLKLAEVLSAFQAKKYNLPLRINVQKFSLVNWFNLASLVDPECGTTACAVGIAGVHPWFIARGFNIFGRTPMYVDRDGKMFEGWDAVGRFFGMPTLTTYYVFVATAYSDDVQPRDVARRLKQCVAGTLRIPQSFAENHVTW